MLPPDVASNLRPLVVDQQQASQAQPQALLAAQKVADVLSDLAPGQRIIATIQAMLPNGTFRAVVAQRDVTLALPFSAKPGDSLELEVTENNGKLALAVVADHATTRSSATPQDSVATSLSQTGKLIGDLLGEIGNKGGRAPPAPLNGSQPLVETMPYHASDLATVLKQTLTQSGMFYEAHQARWTSGEFPTASLLQEPQGQHSQLRPLPERTLPPTSPEPPTTAPRTEDLHDDKSAPAIAAQERVIETKTTETKTPPQNIPAQHGPGIPENLAPLVQQQLDALATQTFAWQGQIWPGQQMHWEIEQHANEEGHRGDDDTAATWRTYLNLNLPQLGGISAKLYLRPGGEIGIELTAESAASEPRLNSAATQLGEQLAAAGLTLTQFSVRHGETS